MKHKTLKAAAAFMSIAMLVTGTVGCTSSTPTPTQTPATQAPATQAPATQAPATQAPATQAPATQAPATPEVPQKQSIYPLKEKTTLVFWDMFNAAVSSMVTSMTDTPLYKELEKQTNIHIEFLHAMAGTGTTAAEQFNLLIASGDWPDLIGEGVARYQGQRAAAFEDGIIIDMKPYLEEKLPNYKKFIDTYPELSKFIETENGNMLAFPAIKNHNEIVWGPVLRKDWLEDLNMPIPETISEWYDTLTAFKTKKGAEAPYTGSWSTLRDYSMFTGAYGVTPGYHLQNGKVVYGYVQDGYKDFLTEMARWYKDGLIDAEIFTLTSELIDSKITGDKAGATIAYSGSGIGRYLGLMKESNPKFNLTGAPYVVLNKGDFSEFNYTEMPVNMAGSIAITTKCKNLDAAFALLDYGYTYEGHYLWNFGVEGVSYEWKNNYPKYTDIIMKNPDGYPMGTILNLYTRSVTSGPMIQDARYGEQYTEYAVQLEAKTNWAKSLTHTLAANHTIYATLSSDDSATIAPITTDIQTFRNERFAKWLAGEEDINAGWDAYVTELNRMGLPKILEIRQATQDRYVQKYPDALKPIVANPQEYIQKLEHAK